MGLDANAGYLNPKKEQQDNVVDINENIGDRMESPYYWRKHARMQQFMMELHDSKNNGPAKGQRDGMMDSFNGGDILYLERDDIETLLKLVEQDNLPFCPDGFFWGHQFQEESMREYKAQDIQFCKDALQWIDSGLEVWYDCSW